MDQEKMFNNKMDKEREERSPKSRYTKIHMEMICNMCQNYSRAHFVIQQFHL